MIVLLNSDARYLPLADRSVHCAITSPPYWGLRSYGVEPGVWGGDPGCDHLWGSTIVENATNHTDKRRWQHTRNGRDELQPPEKRVGWKRVDVVQGTFCQHCGAWRGCLGLEPTPDLYVEHIVACMREVWRVLRDDGTLWLVIGDSYNAHPGQRKTTDKAGPKQKTNAGSNTIGSRHVGSLKPKDLCMIPARVALALQADGWWLRSDIIWAKTNPMPESVMDRPTTAHEYVFLLAKRERYFYDAEAIKEAASMDSGFSQQRLNGKHHKRKLASGYIADASSGTTIDSWTDTGTRNRRSVWTVSTKPYSGAHFAVFPEDLIEPMVLAGTSARGCCPACSAPWVRVVEHETMEIKRSIRTHELGRTRSSGTMIKPPSSETIGWRPSCDCDAGDPIPCTVLDPFSGTATVGRVCARHGRRFVGGELNREYIALARERTSDVQMELGE